jgi:hypothetical protein
MMLTDNILDKVDQLLLEEKLLLRKMTNSATILMLTLPKPKTLMVDLATETVID